VAHHICKTIQNKQINLYPEHKISFDTLEKKQQAVTEHWKLLEAGIGYINLKSINKKELQKAFENLKDTHGIIIDLRNYPKYLQFYDVPKHILPKRTQFIKVLGPVLPSYAAYDIKAPMRFLLNPFKVGRKNSNHYQGKIVLLVDASTGSNAEFIAMTIQSAPNCITMGSKTFGAVLNRNEVILTDNTTLDFTGMGAFYPDTDMEAQRNGLRIDIKIQPSTASYEKDVFMEKARDFLRKTR
jgi:C-terminal processing protease CtpA/Prc